jgi:hypothetical protein
MALSQIGLVGLAVMGQVGWVLSEQLGAVKAVC